MTRVDHETIDRLRRLNREFYAAFGGEFSATRSGEGVNLKPLHKYLANDIRLLDAGCGNGRLAEALDHAGLSLDYVGVDGSAELVGHAEKKCAALKHVRARLYVADLTVPQWSERLRRDPPFDAVVALAILHHIPGFELRSQVLNEIRALLKPGGIFIMSNWQFLGSERLRKKIVPWETIGMTNSNLEPGDFLVDWKRGGTGYRYVHLVDELEAMKLARASGFQVVEQFYADNELNLYSILESPISAF